MEIGFFITEIIITTAIIVGTINSFERRYREKISREEKEIIAWLRPKTKNLLDYMKKNDVDGVDFILIGTKGYMEKDKESMEVLFSCTKEEMEADKSIVYPRITHVFYKMENGEKRHEWFRVDRRENER